MSTTEEAKGAFDEAAEVITSSDPKVIAEMTRQMGTGLAAMVVSLITGGVAVKKMRTAYSLIREANEKVAP